MGFVSMGIVSLLVAILGIGDILSLRVERMFFAAGDSGADSWNEAQRSIARKYRFLRCSGEALLLVIPGLLGFFEVWPAWSGLLGLALYLPIGLGMYLWVKRAVPKATGSMPA